MVYVTEQQLVNPVKIITFVAFLVLTWLKLLIYQLVVFSDFFL